MATFPINYAQGFFIGYFSAKTCTFRRRKEKKKLKQNQNNSMYLQYFLLPFSFTRFHVQEQIAIPVIPYTKKENRP